MAELGKHKRDDDCCDLSLLCSPAKSARVQGVLTQLSPMKAGKYFDGRLADTSSTSIRIVGFDAKKQEQLAHIYETKQSLVMKNCQIVKSKYSDDLEVLLTKNTQIVVSEKKFDVHVEYTAPHVAERSSNTITLDSLSQCQDYENVNVSIKVLDNDAPVEVKTGLVKQDLTVADETGTARLTLWQSDISSLDVGKSYKLEALSVRSYNGMKYLTPPKSGWKYDVCDDINIPDDQAKLSMTEEDKRGMSNAVVDGVLHIGTKFSCIACKSIVERSGAIGKCTKCSMSQRLDKCTSSMTAKLLVSDGEHNLVLHAFLPMIKCIAQDDSITELTNGDEILPLLLMADKFNVLYTADNIIYSVYRD